MKYIATTEKVWELLKSNTTEITKVIATDGDVMGVYSLNGKKIWIKTDLDEITQTTIFLPEE